MAVRQAKACVSLKLRLKVMQASTSMLSGIKRLVDQSIQETIDFATLGSEFFLYSADNTKIIQGISMALMMTQIVLLSCRAIVLLSKPCSPTAHVRTA